MPHTPAFRASVAHLRAVWSKAVHSPSAMIVANTGAQSALRLVSNIILARLLAPSAFALIAITTLILTGLQMVSDVGIAITALREGEMSEEKEAKLWTMQMIRGLGVGLLMLAAAVPVGWIYDDARLTGVLAALALMPVIGSAQSLYPVMALAHRRLLPSTLLEVGSRIVNLAVSVLVALVSPTVWSLVAATLAGVMFTTVGSHLFARRVPRFVFDFAYIKEQWRFSRWIQTSSTLTFVGSQIDKALFPFLFGMTALGLYGIGAAFAVIPAQATQRWSGSVFYPLSVQLLKGDERARMQLFRVRTTMLLYTSILVLGVMAIAPAFFLLLYEPLYHPAFRFAQILAIGTIFDTAEASLRHLPLVDGTPHFEVWTVLVRLAAFGIAVLTFHLLGAGMTGYALSYTIGLAASYLFMLIIDVRRGYLRPRFDILLMVGLTAAAIAIYLAPLDQASGPALFFEVGLVVLGGAGAMLWVYLRRGLPSISAEPVAETPREVAPDDLDTLSQRV